MALAVGNGTNTTGFVQFLQIPPLNPQVIDPTDDFNTWSDKIIAMAAAAAGHEVGQTLADLYAEAITIPPDPQKLQNLAQHLEECQPGTIFHKAFDYTLLQNWADPATQTAVLDFIKQKYNLSDEEARAYSQGVSFTGLKFLPTGEIDYANSKEEFQNPITIADITPLNLQWNNGVTDQQKVDAFAPKFAAIGNNIYHTRYASLVLPLLKNDIGHAANLATSIQTQQDWAKKIGGFKVEHDGFSFNFHNDANNPAAISSQVSIKRDRFESSNAEDCAVDALVVNTQLAMQADPEAWKFGAKIRSDKPEELIKVAAAFRAAGIKLDNETKQRLNSLFQAEPAGRPMFEQKAVEYANRWSVPNFGAAQAAALKL